jgi:hypothetical protein
VLQKSGGAFALTADANFGANFGLVSAFYKSYAANSAGNIATAGVVRLGNAESVSWRNAANGANKSLTVDASDKLAFDAGTGVTGTELGYVSGVTSAIQTQVNTKAPSASPTFTGTVVLPSGQALTSPALTTPTVATSETYLAGAEVRFNNAANSFYAGFKAQAALAANKIWSLPLVDGSANQVLQTDGSAILSWATVATDVVAQYNVKVGDSGGAAQQANTNLIGDALMSRVSQSYAVTSAAPGVFTVAAHGLLTGDRIYLTVTQNGFTANTAYYVHKIDANTFHLSTSYANVIAATYITSSGTTAGTIISGGVKVLAADASTIVQPTVGNGFLYESSTFTGTLTGMTGSVTATASYVRVGKSVTLYFPGATGTSNTTAMTLTGAPATIIPTTTQALFSTKATNGGGTILTAGIRMSSAGVIDCFTDMAGAAWTGSGTKGLSTLTYAYSLF